mmetsp:Transcript_58382/g.102225  ORF Transcript_58382/g.102225 Transcript_58382/m.102225 type:complete len:244 (-) Transcript_58382:921-1652(-)
MKNKNKIAGKDLELVVVSHAHAIKVVTGSLPPLLDVSKGNLTNTCKMILQILPPNCWRNAGYPELASIVRLPVRVNLDLASMQHGAIERSDCYLRMHGVVEAHLSSQPARDVLPRSLFSPLAAEACKTATARKAITAFHHHHWKSLSHARALSHALALADAALGVDLCKGNCSRHCEVVLQFLPFGAWCETMDYKLCSVRRFRIHLYVDRCTTQEAAIERGHCEMCMCRVIVSHFAFHLHSWW